VEETELYTSRNGMRTHGTVYV